MTQTELTEEQSERIRDFVAALRSGEYAQTRNQLATPILVDTGKRAYCCEGVAFERYHAQLGYRMDFTPGGSMKACYDSDDFTKFQSSAVAPPAFWGELGLRTDSYNGFAFVLPDSYATRDERRDYVEYAALNDAGFTFPQIADLIEWQFLSGDGK